LSLSTFRILDFERRVCPMRTRFPFQYGGASLSSVPHIVISARVETDHTAARGIGADTLPPKWFTKDPAQPYELEVAEMVAVIEHAIRVALRAAASPVTWPDFWRSVYQEQMDWAARTGRAPLLAQFGVSLVERPVLDALCRAFRKPLREVVAAGLLMDDLGFVRPALAGFAAASLPPARPPATVILRHTIGMGDWLEAASIPPGERLDDGLPQALDDSVVRYGLHHFKIKLQGDTAWDRERLLSISRVLDRHAPDHWKCTIDGNEAFQEIEAFCQWFSELAAEPALSGLWPRLLFLEQPLARGSSLDPSLRGALAGWKNAPPLLLDEGDSTLDALPRALETGYSGVSHKNCKGITKGLANAALIRQSSSPQKPLEVSGEDLASVGPVATLQDLAVQTLIGATHVERNGHHYFRGLTVWPESVAEAARRAHPELYSLAPGFPAMIVKSGEIDVTGIQAAPLGCGLAPEVFDDLPELGPWLKQGMPGLDL
jgi:hypothetical protein